jgi:hypothetical protein
VTNNISLSWNDAPWFTIVIPTTRDHVDHALPELSDGHESIDFRRLLAPHNCRAVIWPV